VHIKKAIANKSNHWLAAIFTDDAMVKTADHPQFEYRMWGVPTGYGVHTHATLVRKTGDEKVDFSQIMSIL
jgi:hypothetical protein